MIPENKIRVIHQQLKNGEPEGEIREKLKLEGYTEEEIQQVFKPHKYDMRSWYLIFGIVISIAGLFNVNTLGGLIILLLGFYLLYSFYKETERLKQRSE